MDSASFPGMKKSPLEFSSELHTAEQEAETEIARAYQTKIMGMIDRIRPMLMEADFNVHDWDSLVKVMDTMNIQHFTRTKMSTLYGEQSTEEGVSGIQETDRGGAEETEGAEHEGDK